LPNRTSQAGSELFSEPINIAKENDFLVTGGRDHGFWRF